MLITNNLFLAEGLYVSMKNKFSRKGTIDSQWSAPFNLERPILLPWQHQIVKGILVTQQHIRNNQVNIWDDHVFKLSFLSYLFVCLLRSIGWGRNYLYGQGVYKVLREQFSEKGFTKIFCMYQIVNSLKFAAAKSSLTIFVKAYMQKHSW